MKRRVEEEEKEKEEEEEMSPPGLIRGFTVFENRWAESQLQHFAQIVKMISAMTVSDHEPRSWQELARIH